MVENKSIIGFYHFHGKPQCEASGKMRDFDKIPLSKIQKVFPFWLSPILLVNPKKDRP